MPNIMQFKEILYNKLISFDVCKSVENDNVGSMSFVYDKLRYESTVNNIIGIQKAEELLKEMIEKNKEANKG